MSIPLMKDVLSILSNSKCEVMLCVDINDVHITPSRSQKRAKNIVVFCLILAAQYIGMKFCQWALLVHHKYGWITLC